MTLSRSLIIAILLYGALPGAYTLAQATAKPPTAAPPANPLLEAIRTAPDPSSTVDAYARGLATGRVSAVELKQAYVGRMAELRVPELADAQAHDLINRGAADAMIVGIAAYNDAGRGNARAAIRNLRIGLTHSPQDPFLLRTAAQVVAWYDLQAGQSDLSREDVDGIEWLRAAGGSSQEFAETYRLVAESHQQARAAQTKEGQRSSDPARYSGDGGAQNSDTHYYYGYYYPSSYYGYRYGYAYSANGYNASAYSILTLRDAAFGRDRAGLDRRGLPTERGAGHILQETGGWVPNGVAPPALGGAGRGSAPRPPSAHAPPNALPRPPSLPPAPPRPFGPPPGPPHP